MKILVAAGGLSPERDVSLTSGTLIANALMENGHSVAFADIYEEVPETSAKNGFSGLYYNKESGKRFSYKVPDTEPDIEGIIKAHGNRRDQVGPRFLELCKSADTVFVALHGGIGENDTLVRERILESLEFIGLKLDAQRNAAMKGKKEGEISAEDSAVKAVVVSADEEIVLASEAARLIESGGR